MGEDKWKMIVGLWLWIIKYQEGYQSISILLQNFFSDYYCVIWLRLMWSDGILKGDWFFFFFFLNKMVIYLFSYSLVVGRGFGIWLCWKDRNYSYKSPIIHMSLFRLFIYYYSFFFNLLWVTQHRDLFRFFF